MTKKHQTVFSQIRAYMQLLYLYCKLQQDLNIERKKKYESVLINGAACLCQEYTFMSIMHMYIYMTLHEDFKQINLLYI